jgi:hypothetical protein
VNPEIKTRWVAALRSGKYPQGRGRLKTEEGFCCLGVLCDLAAEDGIGHWEQKDTYFNRHYFLVTTVHENNYLPMEVATWAGLHRNPFVGSSILSALNDSGSSFAEIADLIERHL